MEIIKSTIKTGGIAVSSVVISLAINKYIIDFFPEKPTLTVYIIVAVALMIMVLAVAGEAISKKLFKSKHNWNTWQTIHYLEKWAGYGTDRVPKLIVDLRQAALDGDITVWAEKGITAPLDIVPKEKFATYKFDVRSVFSDNANANLPPQSVPKIYESGQLENYLHKEIYYEPHFCKAEIKRKFPRHWTGFRTNSHVKKPLVRNI